MLKRWRDRGQTAHHPQLPLFRYVSLLVALLLLLSSTPLLLAQDGSDDNQTANTVYLPVVAVQHQVSANDLLPLAPETYSADGENEPTDAQIVASTFCSAYIKFSNHSSYPVKIYWVNSHGNETLYKTLNAGHTYWQHSYYGHVWRVRNSSGQLLKQVAANSCSTIYVTIDNSHFPTPTPTTPTCLGDFVWDDANRNGTQDTNEAGIANVSIDLWVDSNNDGSHDTLVSSTTSNSSGAYSFCGLNPAKRYVVKFKLPACYKFTTPNVGDDAKDSDVTVFSYGGTDLFALLAGQTKSTVDAGMYNICQPPTPTPTPIPPPTNTPVPQLAKLGDRVWEDVNRDGIQNNGEPGVDGIQVELFDCNRNRVRSTVTANGGNYLFSDLPAGCYIVRFVNVSTNTFTFTTGDVGDDSADSDAVRFDSVTPGIVNGETDPINLAAGADNRTVDAGLVRPPLGSIGDRVWNDLDRDGVQDGGEPGYADATVQLKDCNGNVIRTTQTDSNGIYRFDNLAAGCYSIGVVLPSGYQFSPQDRGGNDNTDSDINPANSMTANINLNAGQNIDNVDAGINQPPVVGNNCIGDFIWADVNRNGIQDGGENGVAGATINVENTGGTVIASATSDANGNYQICNLPTNTTLFVQLIPPAGYLITDENEGADDTIDSDFSSLNGYSGTIVLPPGQNNFTIDGGLVPATASVGDRVWADDATPNGIQDPGDLGLPGATVKLFSSNGNTIATQTTDSNGNYLFTNLPAGNYYICFTPPAPPPVFISVLQNQGSDDTVDSDASQANNCTAIFTLTTGADLTIDAGFIDP